MNTLAARLSSSTAKVLLSQLVSRVVGATQPEFATRGPGSSNLLLTITQESRESKAQQVSGGGRDSNDSESANEEMAITPPAPVPDRLVLEEGVREGAGSDVGERCRLADEKKDRHAQVEALRGVWDVVFPEEEYPYQRLTDSTAKGWLSKYGSAEFIGDVLMDIKQTNQKHLDWPRSYVDRVLQRQWERRQPIKDAIEIDEDLRALARMGRKQHGYN